MYFPAMLGTIPRVSSIHPIYCRVYLLQVLREHPSLASWTLDLFPVWTCWDKSYWGIDRWLGVKMRANVLLQYRRGRDLDGAIQRRSWRDTRRWTIGMLPLAMLDMFKL